MDASESSGSSPSDDDRPPARSTVELADPGALLTAADARWLLDHARQALALLAVPGEVRVKAVDDAEMADAHLRYADTPGTTDVLTFDLSGHPDLLDADVMVCVDEGARRADEHGHDLRSELLLYVVHAVLHCLGHDDHEPDDFERMHAAEDDLLTRLGVGPVFRPGRTPEAAP